MSRRAMRSAGRRRQGGGAGRPGMGPTCTYISTRSFGSKLRTTPARRLGPGVGPAGLVPAVEPRGAPYPGVTRRARSR